MTDPETNAAAMEINAYLSEAYNLSPFGETTRREAIAAIPSRHQSARIAATRERDAAVKVIERVMKLQHSQNDLNDACRIASNFLASPRESKP